LPAQEKEVTTALNELEARLRDHPGGPKLPALEDARQLNTSVQNLHELTSFLTAPPPDTLPKDVVARLDGALESFAKIVDGMADANRNSPADLVPVLQAYLDRLPDLAPRSASLARLQKDLWDLKRAIVVQRLAEAIKKGRGASASPASVLEQLARELQDVEEDVKTCQVHGHSELLNDVSQAHEFCQTWGAAEGKSSPSYPFSFRIVSAFDNFNDRPVLAPRCLTIRSPGRTDWLTKGGVELRLFDKPIPIDIRAVVEWGEKCHEDFVNSIQLTINDLVLNETAKSHRKTSTQLPIQRIEARIDKELTCKAKIELTGRVLVTKRHGDGGATFKVRDLLNAEQQIPLDVGGNKIRLTATAVRSDELKRWHTKETQYDGELGLGRPVQCTVWISDGDQGADKRWRKVHEFDLTTDPGPLAPIGFPLHLRDRDKIAKLLEGDGIRLELELTGFPQVPPLIWDAAEAGGEQLP
jgi:hypothetical protein